MARHKEKGDPQRPRRLREISDSIADDYDAIRGKGSDIAQNAGYNADAFRQFGAHVEKLPDDPLLGDIEKELTLHHDLTQRQRAGLEMVFRDVSTPAHVALSDALTTTSMINEIYTVVGEELMLDPPPGWAERERVYAEKLATLDPEIAKVYKSVPEIFYGTEQNAERAALFQMRQMYDHFFEKLAPDDEVRNSEHFARKGEPGKENAVHRIERIRYAAYTRVKDKNEADRLVASAHSLLATYEKLQEAHKRGPLKRESVKNAVQAMRAQLERWIDALEW